MTNEPRRGVTAAGGLSRATPANGDPHLSEDAEQPRRWRGVESLGLELLVKPFGLGTLDALFEAS